MKKYAVLSCLVFGVLMLPLSGCMYSTAYEIPAQYKENIPQAPISQESTQKINFFPEENKSVSSNRTKELLPALINAEHPLPEDYVPESMACIGDTSYQLEPEAAKACEDLLAAAEKDGAYGLHIVSAYRSFQKQTALFAQKISAYRNTYGAKAAALAATVVAPAGESEHQSGLAVDICTGSSLVASFGATPEGIWLENNCWRFGFVVRYPASKSEITGITYEPWHLRYVGKTHAKTMIENGWCLEEYLKRSINREVNS